jgi:hypothetical protein
MNKMIALAVALALAIPAPQADAFSIYLMPPQPYVDVCDPGEYLSVQRGGGVIQFRCYFGKHLRKSYISFQVTETPGTTICVEPRGGMTQWQGDGWYRITYNIVPGSVTAADDCREF